MTMTTHDLQVASYVEEYRGPSTAASAEAATEALDSEITALMKEIRAAQVRILEAQVDLERLTDRNLTAIRSALAGKQ